MTEQEQDSEPQGNKKPGLRQVISSTLAAFFGVQSNKNRERDFTHGNIKVYIISGLIFTLLFIGTVVTVVTIVLSSTTG